MKTADLPSTKQSGMQNKDQFINYFLKPNKENEQYRLRLVWYRQPAKNDRTDPYIVQQIHDHWGETTKGVKVVDDTIICPGTKYAKYDDEKFVINEKTGKKTLNCPICKKANEAMVAYRASGKRDKISMQRFNALKAKFRACVPVYVVDDPNAWDKDHEKNYNNGKLKVLIFTNKEEFERFDNLVQEEKSKSYLASKDGKPYEVFNGENAVDLFIRMENVPEVRYAGTEKEYVANVRKITQMAFGKKAYNIPSINKENIDSFEFDDQFYISNTKEELKAFFKKYYGQEELEVPQEDVDVFGTTEKKTGTVTTVENTVKMETTSEGPDVDIDVNLDEDESHVKPSIIENTSADDSDVPSDTDLESILNELE